MTRVISSFQFSQRSQTAGAKEHEPQWVPNTDVYETDDGLVIKVELAGVRREELDITVDGNSLRIAGQRADECRSSRRRFLVMEINYDAFESVIDLPPGFDISKARASYQNGFLRVDVPVAPSASSGAVSPPVTET
jgi:HSP20 family protein